MIKIKISYQKPQELEQVLKLLKPVLKSCKVKKEPKGQYKKAYIAINSSKT